jgi:PilZ domain
VSSCPVCATNAIYASHRRGILERGPLSWIGVFPFRCGQCNARFYRFSPGAKRHRVERTLEPTGSDHLRPLRWSIAAEASVTLYREDGSTNSLVGRVENASGGGMGLLLPTTLPEGSLLNVEIPDIPSRLGRVRWVKAGGPEGTLHGLEFESRGQGPVLAYRPARRGRARRVRRRVFVGFVSLALLALAAYGLVWLIEEFRGYRPAYYEPKDMERQPLHQRQAGEAAPRPADH